MVPSPVAGGPAGLAGLPPQQRVIEKQGVRILCIADVRGNLRSLNTLAKQANADHIIHTGDFGFYDSSSLERIADKTLRHVAQYSPLLTEQQKRAIQSSNVAGATVKDKLASIPNMEPIQLSELQHFLTKKYTLDVPVYTVWGACEDVRVLEKFRSGEYKVDNLHIIDEANSRLLDVGGVKLRLLGLGGAVVMHKLFDNGQGKTTIAGGQGTMWTTLLQIGELVDTANRVYDPTETRVFITHASPAREGLLNQLSVTLKADFSISAGLHFRYGSSYNEFSVNPTLDHYRGKLALSKASFNDVWETVKSEVQPQVSQNEAQQRLIRNALDFIEKMPASAAGAGPFGGGTPNVDESAFKNMWNFNLADAAFGWLVLEVENGRIGTEMKAQGFNFSHRAGKVAQPAAQANSTPAPAAPPAGPAAQRNIPSGPAAQNGGAQQQQIAPAVPPFNQAGRKPGPPSAPPTPANAPAEPVKPATPRPQPGRTPTPSQQPATDNESLKPDNGTAKPSSPTTPSDPSGSRYQPKEQKPGLYISNVSGEDKVRSLFNDEWKAKISSIQEKITFKTKLPYYYVFFETEDEAKAALDALPKELQSRPPPDAPGRAWIKKIDMDQVRPNTLGESRGWGSGRGDGSSRGSFGPGRDGGFRGQSSASESEGGPGGFSRGRGRGRGGFGERKPSGQYEPRGGSMRGGRGGRRGGFNKDEGASTPTAE
ncbi:hypothetical protein BJ508DRAFT_112681 [Ascobolus immersus RN42]|uniref:Uncharacterized protein n=1 Tax=Ascobolus immersus RN42 TaxID=1160509 RepID=A0A3N4IBC6_ASCIM|nr:hypothetical protein BJ508DRAFT_112681 [Ascobolus immersus RN42]